MDVPVTPLRLAETVLVPGIRADKSPAVPSVLLMLAGNRYRNAPVNGGRDVKRGGVRQGYCRCE